MTTRRLARALFFTAVACLALVPRRGAIGEDSASPDAEALIRALRDASETERPALIGELLDLDPSERDAVEEVRGAADLDPEVAAELERVSRWLLARRIFRLFDEGLASNLTYAGQYEELTEYGDDGVEALLGIVDDTSTPFEYRLTACRAIADVAGASVLPEIRRLHRDVLLPIALRRELGIVLASLGDTRAVDDEIADSERYARRDELAFKLPALLELANLRYRIRDYREALACYDEVIAIYEELIEGQPNPEVRRSLDEDLTLHYYNAACSSSLHGDLDKAKRYLREAVRRDPVHLESIELDGDLSRLRASDGYEEFRRELDDLFEGEEL